ncbi:hypothetical protein MRX96_004817 [Rhipicephalus microplus]
MERHFRWTTECFGTGKNAVVAWIATATALVLLIVLVGQVADLPRSEEGGAPAVAAYRREQSAGNHRSDFLLSLPHDNLDVDYPDRNNDDSTTTRLEEGENAPDDNVGSDERTDAFATATDGMPSKENAATSDVTEKPHEPARSSLHVSVRSVIRADA